ncbi:MAG: twin-arginine translocation signal domain-containing protein [Acidimicrobiia bacterium]
MTVTQRLVDVTSRKIGRRGFLGRAALVGSAAVVSPFDFIFRPNSAYAAVCGPNSLCSAGYTEFCCTITGVNACPAGTVTGGWWKVDGSEFCGGAPRFYLDCNAQCGGCGCGSNGVCDGSCSGTGCGCARGDCNNRKSGCVKFRYGQCNQHIACLGPIVCRVATCTPPWLFDASCTTSSRTDENTRGHSRPCLEESFGAINQLEYIAGELVIGGWAMNQDDYREAAHVRVYVDGVVAADVVADIDRPDVGAAYPFFGARHGFFLKVPMADPGPRYVCLFMVDASTGRGSFLNFQEVEVPGPMGDINQATAELDGSVSVTGWALDPTQPNMPPTVRIYVDGLVVSELIADLPRPDVAEFFQVDERCGFSVNLPATTASAVCIDVVDRFGVSRWVACQDVVGA